MYDIFVFTHYLFILQEYIDWTGLPGWWTCASCRVTPRHAEDHDARTESYRFRMTPKSQL